MKEYPFREDGESFSIDKLADLIEEVIGIEGLVFFGLGFISAAVSSMLAVPLGAAQTADSMFTINTNKYEIIESQNGKKKNF